MRRDRRDFMGWTAGTIVSVALAAAAGGAPRPRRTRRIDAVAFDAFAVFDPRPIAGLAGELFPGKGAELMTAWRARQFEYTWLRTLSRRYVDFWRTTEDALVYAAGATGVDLDGAKRERLMGGFLALEAWPDVPPALEALRSAGIRMALLSNFTAAMLDAAVARSRLTGTFEPHLTTDRVKAYKPHPRAYQMGVEAFGLPRERIAFVASASWDAAGAKWFGYPTIWTNRMGARPEELGVVADMTGSDLAGLLELVHD